jgi:hypothetical protein
MATKKLSRTVVEGGRRGRWEERYADRRVKRAIKRKLSAGDQDPHDPRCRYWGSEFSDKLQPVYGYLRKNAGRPWDKVYSELCQRYDRRTLKGWHLLSAHIDRHMVDGHGERWPWVVHGYGPYIDRHGILRYTQRKRYR